MAAGAVLLGLPGVAAAHVKWFCGPIDGTLPPAPVAQVLSAFFFMCALLFGSLVAAGSVADALLVRFIPRARLKARLSPRLGDQILRAGMSIYCLCLWRKFAIVLWAGDATGAVLTPEMLRHDHLVGALQVMIAIMLPIPRLSAVAALGLTVLYALGVNEFGLFYMVDYTFFLGIAAYLVLADPLLRTYPRLAGWRVPLLTASLSVSLMWTAVEKFLYPQWTIAVLLLHPKIAAGFALPTVATVAGFVEFSLAFYLLVGDEILVRVAAILLMGVFVVAMPTFGIVDVVGHISVIAILLLAFLNGETALQRTFRGVTPRAVMAFPATALRFAGTLAIMVALYYGGHLFAVWHLQSVRTSLPS